MARCGRRAVSLRDDGLRLGRRAGGCLLGASPVRGVAVGVLEMVDEQAHAQREVLALRKHGVDSISKVKSAYMEGNGDLTVITLDESSTEDEDQKIA